MTMKYAVELTETQMRVVQHALDMYFRVGMGQLREVLEHLVPKQSDHNEWLARRDLTEERIRLARRAAMPELDDNASYGIYSEEIDKSNRIAADVHDVIRYRLAWDKNPEGGFAVSFDRVSPKSTEPLPVIRRMTAHSEDEAVSFPSIARVYEESGGFVVVIHPERNPDNFVVVGRSKNKDEAETLKESIDSVLAACIRTQATNGVRFRDLLAAVVELYPFINCRCGRSHARLREEMRTSALEALGIEPKKEP